MTPGRQEVIVAAPLNKIGGRSSIDFKIESQIPAKVRSSQNNKTAAGLSAGRSNPDYASTKNNEKNFGGGGVT